MRVKIGPYKSWFGPYQLAEKLMFWVPKEVDEYGIEHVADRVHNFGEWLAHGSVLPEPEVGEVYDMWEDRPQTWLYKFLSWVYSKREQKVEVHIDRWDTWSMDVTLGYIVRPMLKQLKDKKHGAPQVDYDDVPKNLRPTKKEIAAYNKDGTTDDKFFERWDWVIDEMIFAFESLDGGANQDWEEQFETGTSDLQLKKLENGNSQMVEGPNHTREYDWEGRKVYQKRITNGFRLFGKYFESLWD
jgi:hypothetical protein